MSFDELFPDHYERKLRDLIEPRLVRAAEEIISDFERRARRCESPIEVMLLAAFQDAGHPCFPTLCDEPFLLDAPPPPGIWLFPQAKIGRYRVDFAVCMIVENGRSLLLVIECDGHDFHEKTKQQAASDKRRDRELTALGARVLRFTGSEIWKAPSKCVDEVMEILWEGFNVSEQQA